MRDISYTAKDSVKIVTLLSEAAEAKPTNAMLHFARKFMGVRYVSHTLERNRTEKLIVNLSELDCTTFVETVTALSLCHAHGQKSFSDYCRMLLSIRYSGNKVSYATRNHYFSSWIASNAQQGFVAEVDIRGISGSKGSPFCVSNKPRIDFMTQHKDKYLSMGREHGSEAAIRKTEQALSNTATAYIPKTMLKNSPEGNKTLKRIIHSGDIIAITTSIPGLDTSHIGIAVWHNETLHLINASQIHKRVIDEPMTLYDYMQRHPKQTGIRVVRTRK